MSGSIYGGSFLMQPVGEVPQAVPEQLPEELRQLRQTAIDFIEGEVMPRDGDIEHKTPGVMPTLLKKAGELGFLLVEVPEQFGGAALGKVASTAVTEGLAGQASFLAAFSCHTGIGTLPLLHYGNEVQRGKYLPKLATGEMLASYALTEAGSGSDALAARTTAVKTADGKFYLLNGEKMFITNGGFADLYTVFAKVDGEQFSAFLVERTMAGVSHGPEEQKLGMKGSSTVPLILQDAKVPVENLLGEVGKGHKIAFNTLNVGRWKLGAACLGSCKGIVRMVVQYVKERQQFGQPLAHFELIQQRVAEEAVQAYLVESVIYRYAGDLDCLNAAIDKSAPGASLQQVQQTEELVIEASICKVFASEALNYLGDDAVQLFGGYGYIEDYRPAHYYRDNRINRIWEGTNEINRLLIPGTMLKRMVKGTLDLLTEVQTIMGELRSGFPTVPADAPLAEWQNQVNQLKKLAVYAGGVAVNTYGPEIQERQQVLFDLADLMIGAFVADTAMARVLTLLRAGLPAELPTLMTQCYLAQRIPQLKVVAQQLLCNVVKGDAEQFVPIQKAVQRFCPPLPFDLCAARKTVADAVLHAGGYPL